MNVVAGLQPCMWHVLEALPETAGALAAAVDVAAPQYAQTPSVREIVSFMNKFQYIFG